MVHRLRIALVDPSDAGYGSMARYGDLVADALTDAGGDCHHVERFRVGLPRPLSGRTSAATRTLAHHACAAMRAARLASRRFDVWHLLDGSHAHLGSALPRPQVITVHDLIPLLQTRRTLGSRRPSWPARLLIAQAVRGLRRADRIVADSPVTATDLEATARVDPTRITVLGLAVSRSLLPDGHPKPRAAPAQPPIVLHVGTNAFYKNRAGVMRIFAGIRRHMPAKLVMVGPALDRPLLALAEGVGIAADVRVVRDCDDERLADLYAEATVLLFPSLYEGFGWPPLEAMALGCPVVCSTAVAHVVGDAAMVRPASEEAALVQDCLAVLERPDLAHELSARGRRQASTFSRKRMGDVLLETYERAIEGRGRLVATG